MQKPSDGQNHDMSATCHLSWLACFSYSPLRNSILTQEGSTVDTILLVQCHESCFQQDPGLNTYVRKMLPYGEHLRLKISKILREFYVYLTRYFYVVFTLLLDCFYVAWTLMLPLDDRRRWQVAGQQQQLNNNIT